MGLLTGPGMLWVMVGFAAWLWIRVRAGFDRAGGLGVRVKRTRLACLSEVPMGRTDIAMSAPRNAQLVDSIDQPALWKDWLEDGPGLRETKFSLPIAGRFLRPAALAGIPADR